MSRLDNETDEHFFMFNFYGKRPEATIINIPNTYQWSKGREDFFKSVQGERALSLEDSPTLTWGDEEKLDEVKRLAKINDSLRASFPSDGNETTIDWNGF